MTLTLDLVVSLSMVLWVSASRKRSTPKAFRVVPSVYRFAVPARQEQGTDSCSIALALEVFSSLNTDSLS